MPAHCVTSALKIGRYAGIFGLARTGNTVPTSARSSAVHEDGRIGAPLSGAPLPFTAVNSSSWTGSRTTACVSSAPRASAMDTA